MPARHFDISALGERRDIHRPEVLNVNFRVQTVQNLILPFLIWRKGGFIFDSLKFDEICILSLSFYFRVLSRRVCIGLIELIRRVRDLFGDGRIRGRSWSRIRPVAHVICRR